MAAKVLNFTGVTRLNLDPQRVLDAAKDQGLVGVLIIGFDEGGNEYFASSISSGPECLWALKRAEKALLETVDEDD